MVNTNGAQQFNFSLDNIFRVLSMAFRAHILASSDDKPL